MPGAGAAGSRASSGVGIAHACPESRRAACAVAPGGKRLLSRRLGGGAARPAALGDQPLQSAQQLGVSYRRTRVRRRSAP